MNIVSNKVLIEKSGNQDQTESGIIIPLASQKFNEGTVVIIGQSVKHIKVGDRVRYYPTAGTPLDYNGKDCLLVAEDGGVELIL